jgi:hypothetical protein
MNSNVHVSRSLRAPALDLPARIGCARLRQHYHNDESEAERFVCAVAC